jgi:hypothetical protein
MAIVFAGPLSRWFAKAGGDVARVRAGVEAWREDLRASLAAKVGAQLQWDEGATDTFTADLGDAGLIAVRLLAFLADRSELEWPDAVPPLLELVPEWRAAADAKFARSRYGQLLACELWLPGDFPVTFRVPLPDGATAEVGSLQVLADQLRWLNQRTFQADADELADWLALPAPAGGEFVAAARRGLGGLLATVSRAVQWRLPLVVRAT